MIEFLQFCIAPINLPFTILLALVFLYWILIIVGALGIDSFDFGADTDVDMDADVDVDAGGGMIGVLRFFNVGEVPIMIVVSFFVFSMWAIQILANYYLNDTLSVLASLLWLAPNVLLSLFIAKIVSTPFKYMMKHVHAGIATSHKIVGSTCVVKSGEATHTSGQGEILTEGSPLLIHIRTKEGVTLEKGQQALVVDLQDEERGIYTVVKFDLDAKPI